MPSIERTGQEIIIRLPADFAIDDRLLDYLTYKQAIQKSLASREAIDELATEVKRGWWEKNKHRFPDLGTIQK